MMVERLLAYEKKNKRLPERVFVYRDGVSEVRLLTVSLFPSQ
jgi:eukaryotic translation initiation factor 2C